MSKIEFDEPRLKDMDDFFNYIYTIGIENPNISINQGLVYRELCKRDISPDEIRADGTSKNNSYLFNKWMDRNNEVGSRSKGLGLRHKFSWPHFLYFYSTKDYIDSEVDVEFIKLYIPLKYDNLFDSVNVLFDYIRDAGICHTSRVSDRARDDNVTIRLRKNDIESALKIINFIKNNNTIRDNLNKTNPFISTVNGIGFMYEKGISYTEEISILIVGYIKECIRLKKAPTIKEFYLWFIGNNYSKELLDIFSLAIGSETFIDDEPKEMSDSEKNRLLKDAIKATFLKYDMNQVMFALKSLLEDEDYAPFSNGNGDVKYRSMLRDNVTKKDAIRYVESTLRDEDDIDYDTVLKYCQNILKDELLKDFCAACLVTYENYGDKQLKEAIKKMITDNNPGVFARYSIKDAEHNRNYRTIVANFESNGVNNLIKLFLDLNHLDYDPQNPDYMIDLFIGTLVKLNHQNIEDTIKIR